MRFRVVFAGTPDFAVPTFEALLKTHDVVGILTQPDRPKGRGQSKQPTPVARSARHTGFTPLTPVSLDDPDTTAAVRDLNPDFIVVAAYGLLFPETWLHLPNQGILNVHPSLLPRWRGASPIEYALLHGDSETGISIQALIKRLDAGPVLRQVRTAISERETKSSLETRLAVLGTEALLSVLSEWTQIKPAHQDESRATYAPKITPRDTRIRWSSSATAIERQIRALQEQPGAWTSLCDRRVKILDAHVLPIFQLAIPGTATFQGNSGLKVTTGHGTLAIDRLQSEGARPLPVQEWMRGMREVSGIRLI
ncbi:MAG: methionyl-tRNA formyltransferase [Gammaproteobacteria bacterium]